MIRDFDALRLKIASPEEMLSWSHGEVLKPETINYRTQRPEKDGLFSERIFGPTKDWECYCGKYRRIRYKGVVCDKCGVEVTRSIVRRERFGHIALATPIAHIWFLRSIPSRLALLLGVPSQKIEKVIYYSSYIITKVDEPARKRVLDEVNREFENKFKKATSKEKSQLEELKKETMDELARLQVMNVVTEIDYFTLSRKYGEVFEASIGAEAIRNILEHIDLHAMRAELEAGLQGNKELDKKVLQRLRLVKNLIQSNQRPEWMILTVLPVIPPDLRPMVALDGGRYASSDLNDLYRRVINRNNRLKKLKELKAPEVIIRNEKRMLQEAVDALIDNSIRVGGQQQTNAQKRPLKSLADMLKGKGGRFRQNLLGKRVDYSGRSVIAVGPDLKLNECGLPKKMALELFKPFVIHELLDSGIANTIKRANRLIEEAPPEVWGILEEVIKGRYVLLNRAPTLHRLGIQAFHPLLIEDLCIRIPPMVCSAFNADFDGDQMAVHLPLTEDAQKEVEMYMDAKKNVLKPATGEPITLPTQDMVLGCYYLTRTQSSVEKKSDRVRAFSSVDEALLAYEHEIISLHDPILVLHPKHENGKKPFETTVGRLIMNNILPDDYEFVNHILTKGELKKLVTDLQKHYDNDIFTDLLDKIKFLGFEYSTRSGISWSMSDLLAPKEKAEIVAKADAETEKIWEQYQEGLLSTEERRVRSVLVWQKAKAELSKMVPASFTPENSIFMIIDSGARATWAPVEQMTAMKGLVANPRNETIELPIKSSFKEGLNLLEYFISTHGARKGTTDTALKTASAGYLTRRLVDVGQSTFISEEDCGTENGITVERKVGEAFHHWLKDRIFSRTLLEDVKVGHKIIAKAGNVVTLDMAQAIEESGVESVRIRSLLTCKSLFGICQTCYGYDLGYNKPVELGTAAGVIAAQSIGEPGTQLTMRTFHIGGVAGLDITHGLPRVEELFEARAIKNSAVIAESEGWVEAIEEQVNGDVVIRIVQEGKKKQRKEYSIPHGIGIEVVEGQEVKPGTQLTEGHVDIHDLYKVAGKEAVWHYIIQEIQKVYLSEGAKIHDKHIEMVVRQMFSRVRIVDPGDSLFSIGEVVERPVFIARNRDLVSKKKNPAHGRELLLGIKNIASSSYSFLSAASFQETTKALVSAAVEGRIDQLRGLKENVIIGRLIPAGTGYRKEGDEEEPLYTRSDETSQETAIS
ncbi:MAG: DNA-directed RNA polymerase subunit beta' [Patescibacteria group bacterium]|nr:DNA-directed RNA polymerase subunit beta' [Patescibacteria group bacterium]MDE2438023.1 DNA-directed RNA polymerase subunit beta' [Patescibacteria group bacterium]